MRFEVHPEQIAQNNLKWSISLCLTIPPVAPNVFPVGQAGFISNKEKFLIFMHLTRVNTPPGQVRPFLFLVVFTNIKMYFSSFFLCFFKGGRGGCVTFWNQVWNSGQNMSYSCFYGEQYGPVKIRQRNCATAENFHLSQSFKKIPSNMYLKSCNI